VKVDNKKWSILQPDGKFYKEKLLEICYLNLTHFKFEEMRQFFSISRQNLSIIIKVRFKKEALVNFSGPEIYLTKVWWLFKLVIWQQEIMSWSMVTPAEQGQGSPGKE